MPLEPERPVLVLASASPRRIDLLTRAGIPHAVHPTDVDEAKHLGEPPEAYAARLSHSKAAAAAPMYPDLPVLAADTVVVTAEATLGKPAHAGAARQMLQMLSGANHRVLTAYHLHLPGAPARGRVVETAVEVAPLTEEDIEGYLRSEEWRG